MDEKEEKSSMEDLQFLHKEIHDLEQELTNHKEIERLKKKKKELEDLLKYQRKEIYLEEEIDKVEEIDKKSDIFFGINKNTKYTEENIFYDELKETSENVNYNDKISNKFLNKKNIKIIAIVVIINIFSFIVTISLVNYYFVKKTEDFHVLINEIQENNNIKDEEVFSQLENDFQKKIYEIETHNEEVIKNLNEEIKNLKTKLQEMYIDNSETGNEN